MKMHEQAKLWVFYRIYSRQRIIHTLVSCAETGSKSSSVQCYHPTTSFSDTKAHTHRQERVRKHRTDKEENE